MSFARLAALMTHSTCPLCGSHVRDLAAHLRKQHNLWPSEALRIHPNDPNLIALCQQRAICAECAAEYENLTKHLKVVHGLSPQQYVALHPTAHVRSEHNIRNKNQAARTANALRVGVPRPSTIKDKISASKRTNPIPAWNKGVAKTPEERNQASVRMKQWHATHTHPNQERPTPDSVRAKISKTLTEQGRHYSEESQLRRDATIQKKKAAGWVHHNSLSLANRIGSQNLALLSDHEWLYDQHITQRRPVSYMCCLLGLDPISGNGTVNKAIRSHGIEVHRWTAPISAAQHELELFVEECDVEFVANTRSVIPPMELDIYIPSVNLAIEYNGLYWHGELAGKDSSYHLRKTEMCEQRGVRLIHIMEDEWVQQKDKCKETIRHLLHRSERGVAARKTTIREIPWSIAAPFLDRYHLLGAGTPGTHNVGAFYNAELIGLMVFGQQNNESSQRQCPELKRFITNKKNNPGLGSKLFKWAVTKYSYTDVVAFVDRRWFTGDVKHHIGFKVIGVVPPAVWWSNGRDRVHRRFVNKSQLLKLGADKNDSKVVALRKLGWYRIWDSGKLKLHWSAESLD